MYASGRGRIIHTTQRVADLLRATATLFLGRASMKATTTSGGRSIKVGVITDQTGPLSFLGIANANVAKMVIDDINAQGGLLGRKVDLYLEDSATTDSVAAAKAEKLVQQDRVDVVFGGIFSSTRQAIKG